MGLFNRRSSEEVYEEMYSQNLENIKNAGFVVSLDFAIGVYGNDDIIAGSMVGEFGTYLMMNKKGKLKWDKSNLAIRHDGVYIYYNGYFLSYKDLLEVHVQETVSNHVDKQLILRSVDGNYIFKANSVFVDVIANLIVGFKNKYRGWVRDGLISEGQRIDSDEDLEKVRNGESIIHNPIVESDNVKNDDDISDMDRLLRCGELFERGLITEEEFMEFKRKLLNNEDTPDDDDRVVTCSVCGEKIEEHYKFCINCGNQIK